MILREDSCGSWWPLRIDWVTGQVPGENFWILHRSYCFGFSELDAKCDEFWGKLFGFEKEGKEQDECVSKYCCSLTCHIIFRISIRARNFCSSLNCLKDGSRDNKKPLSSSTSVSSIFSAAKSEVVIPRRKFRFASFFEHFEAVTCFLLANCSLPLHCLECFNLLCVSRSLIWGKRNSSWSKYRYLRRFLLPSPDVAFIC